MTRILLTFSIILFTITGVAQTKPKMSSKEIERRCKNLTFEQQRSRKVCAPFLAPFYSETDPLFGKIKPKYQWKVKLSGLLGTIEGAEAMIGYDYNQLEFGAFAGSRSSKEGNSAGEFSGVAYGGYFQYNFFPRSQKFRSSFNPYMGLKLGSSTVKIESTGIESSYPYMGLGAGVNYSLSSNMGLSGGIDFHHILHPQKNLFHLGSNVNLGIFFNF